MIILNFLNPAVATQRATQNLLRLHLLGSENFQLANRCI